MIRISFLDRLVALYAATGLCAQAVATAVSEKGADASVVASALAEALRSPKVRYGALHVLVMMTVPVQWDTQSQYTVKAP